MNLRSLVLLWVMGTAAALAHGQEDRSYQVTTVPVPKGVAFEVTGLAWLEHDRLLCCTRRGELWIVDGPLGPPASMTFKMFGQGFHEPLGLLVHEGWVYLTQRGELTRVRDRDGDDRVDEVETVCEDWKISGNYHEYNFGPRVGPEGDLWITTNKPFGDEPFGRVPWRGFALRIGKDGSITPVACGLRSPAGIERSPSGQMFFTDNQGEWCGAGKLSHIEPGTFHGHPWGLFSCDDPRWPYGRPRNPPDGMPMPEVVKVMPSFRLPAVWFPYDKMGKSPAGFAWDRSDGRFGPYSGHVFVSDQHHASVMRVTLEEVNGHWQGACYPFREGLQCGTVRVAFSPDGSALFCGQTQRGWGSRGSAPEGLQRITWTGETPFDVLEVKAEPQGFLVRFTADVAKESAVDPKSYRLESYTYLLHAPYGSPEVDRAAPVVQQAEWVEGGRAVRLSVQGLRAGYVHELHLPGVRGAQSGSELLHPVAYYTLINIPGGPSAQPPAEPAAAPAPSPSRADSEWTSLFDGKTLDGWTNPYGFGDARAEDGEIALRSDKKFFLVSDREFADFVFEAEVKVPVGGNSGIQFRSHVGDRGVFGYQAEVDTSPRRWAGGIYDEGRRAWICNLEGREDAQAAFIPGEWNRYRIQAEGDHLRVWVNEVLTSELWDGEDLRGSFALQHHGEKGLEVRFRNIRVQEQGAHRWRSILPDPASWSGFGDAQTQGPWQVQDGVLHGTAIIDSPTTPLEWSTAVEDITLRGRFQVTAGEGDLSLRAGTLRDQTGVVVALPGAGSNGAVTVGGTPFPASAAHGAFASTRQLYIAISGHRLQVNLDGKSVLRLLDIPVGRGALRLELGRGCQLRCESLEVLERVPEER